MAYWLVVQRRANMPLQEGVIMKATTYMTKIATPIEFEKALTAEELQAKFAEYGVAGFAAELDVVERAENPVRMVALDELLGFAKASGAAVTYDVTYFPVADEAEVDYQVAQLAEDLGLSAAVIREVCAAEIQEYLAVDAQRDVAVPVHAIVEAYIGGTAFAWYGVNEYARLKKIVLDKLATDGAVRAFARRAATLEVE